jgi:soluble lytic murein transglycosylase-like protein
MPPLDPELDPHFEEAARLNNLDPMLLRAIASGESGGKANATSSANAGGLMQIMPDTASHYKIADPYDPVQAIYGAANILNENLTKAEAAKAAGANIDPTDEALRSYFAGPGGGNRGAQTAAYPGYIAQKYLALQNGQEPPAPPPASGIGALAAAKATPMPAPGAVATNATPPANAPDTFEPAPDAVAALAGYGAATRPVAATGTDALAAVGRPSPAVTSTPGGTNGIVPAGAPQQVAEAAPDPEIADLLAANRKMFGGQPPGAAQTAQPTGAATPVEAPMPSGATTSARMADIKWAQDIVSHRTQVGRPVPGWVDELSKMEPGMPLSPEYQQAAAASAKAGANLQRFNPTTGAVEPIPGSIASDAAKAGAIAEAQQAPVRQTQAEKPAEQRGAGSSVTYPPGSTGAAPWIAAQKAGKATPAGVRINDDGSVEVGNVNVPPEVVHQRYGELEKAADEANASRLGLYEVENLGQKLHAIGTSGPLTEQLGQLSALAQQLGVPQETLAKINIPAAPSVEEAKKLSTDLLGSILHQTLPQRITNTDITAWKGTVPQANNMMEANDFLINNIIKPKFQRSIDRYGFASSISASDPQLSTYYKAMNDWDNSHPFDAYAIAKEFKPAAAQSAPAATQRTQPPSAPPIPGATMGADGKWHAIINGQPHILVPPAGGP